MEPTQRLTTSAPSTEGADQICSVDRALVEDFLNLILNNYRKADEASAFLEHRAGVSNVHAFTNVRDVLSHLCTMLDPATPPEKKRDQLNNAEEHLRRSILEPYEVSFSKLTQGFITVYEDYKKFVEPVIGRYVALNSAPNMSMINSRLREIHELAKKGRSAKGRNLWTPEWEAGVASFVDAYDRLSALKSELEGYYYKYERIQRDEGNASEIAELRRQSGRSGKLTIWGIVATILTFILAAILTLVLAGR